MNRTQILYGILSLIAVVAIGYFAFSYLAPQGASIPGMMEIKPADISFVKSDKFSSLKSYVDLPIKATEVGWPLPFQSIYDRGLPGIYVMPKETTDNESANNANTPKP